MEEQLWNNLSIGIDVLLIAVFFPNKIFLRKEAVVESNRVDTHAFKLLLHAGQGAMGSNRPLNVIKEPIAFCVNAFADSSSKRVRRRLKRGVYLWKVFGEKSMQHLMGVVEVFYWQLLAIGVGLAALVARRRR